VCVVLSIDFRPVKYLKLCSKCNRLFPETPEYFNRKNITRSGLTPHCKKCIRETRKRYYQRNKEKVAKYNKKYQDKNKEKITKYNKEYYQKNKEKKKAYNKEYYQKNKEKIN